MNRFTPTKLHMLVEMRYLRTWYSNSGGATKDNDHVGGRWRLVQNCRVFRSAEFAGTDPIDLMATLKIRLKSRYVAPSSQVWLDVHRFRDESYAQEYKRGLAESLGEPNDSENPEKLRTDFKTQILKASECCLRRTHGASKRFLTKGTLNTIEESHKPRLERKIGQYPEL